MDELWVDGPVVPAELLAALDALAAVGRERRLRREREALEQQARESAQPEGGQGDG